MKKRKLKIPVKSIIIILLSFAALYLSLRSLSGLLWSSEYFNIRVIRTNNKNIDLLFLLGKNIFSLNLNKEAQNILAMYPNYHKIRLIRRLPNALSVVVSERKALAYLRLYRYFAVDGEGVLFNLDNNPLNPNLPIIMGLQAKILGAQAGRSYSHVKELLFCLDLIKEFTATRGLKRYTIKKIDAARPENLSFYMLENMEIKIGQADIERKIQLLNSILAHLGSEALKVKYIDLRFKEPVIKYK